MCVSWRFLLKTWARARAPGGWLRIAQATWGGVVAAIKQALVAALALCLLPFYAGCVALRPATRAVGATKAWRLWLDWRMEAERKLEARIHAVARKFSARSWLLGRRWSKRQMALWRAGGAGARRAKLGALIAGWIAGVSTAIVLMASVALAAPFVAVLFVAVGLQEMGLHRAEDSLSSFARLPMLAMGLLLEMAALMGPCGWVWSGVAAVSRAARIVAKKMPSEVKVSARGPWGVNAFVLSCQDGGQRVACRTEASAGRVDGYELWLDPALARQALDPVGWLGALLGGFGGGPRSPWRAPIARLMETARIEHWEADDRRLLWVRWVEAMKEEGALSKEVAGRGVEGLGRGAPRARRL